ncbi:MAG: glycosyltransferase [Verrucomicrobiales bacterium]
MLGPFCEFADRGADVGIVCLTGGNAEAEGEERERRGELVAAAAELGIAEVRFLDYPDPPAGETGRLFAPEIDSILLVAELRSVLTQPRETDLVITHGSGGEYWHPAHVLLHDHVLRAAKSLTHCPFLATFNAWSADNPLPQVSNRDDIANFSIDVRAYHARRLASLQRHATQGALESLVGFGIDQAHRADRHRILPGPDALMAAASPSAPTRAGPSVVQLSASDRSGGAAVAAARLHAGLREAGVDSRMLVAEKLGTDPFTERIHRIPAFSIRRFLDPVPMRLDRSEWFLWATCAWLPNPALARRIRQLAPDLAHLHGNHMGFTPIAMLPKLKVPVVITMHDFWAFCGAFHLEPPEHERFPEPYDATNRRADSGGIDIDAWVWRRKARACRDRKPDRNLPERVARPRARRSALWQDRRIGGAQCPQHPNLQTARPRLREGRLQPAAGQRS